MNEVVVWALGLAALLAIAEWTARILRRRLVQYAVCQPGLRERIDVLPDVLPSQGQVVRFEANALGERGSDPPRAADASIYRVLVCGGSAAECFTLDQPASWPEVVKQQLAEPAALKILGREHVHLGNVSRSLALPWFVEQILRRLRPRYPRLDLIIIMTGAANTAAWLANRTPTVIDERPPVPENLFAVSPEKQFRLTPRGTALYQSLRDWWTVTFRPIKRGSVGRTLARARGMRAAAKTTLADIPDPAVMVDHFDRGFRSLIAAAREMAPRVLVVRQPWMDKDSFTPTEQAAFWHGAGGHPHLGSVDTYYSLEVVTRLVRLVDRRAAEICDALGVEQVDLLPHLEPSLSTFYDFWHFTPPGAATAANAITAAILRGPRR